MIPITAITFFLLGVICTFVTIDEKYAKRKKEVRELKAELEYKDVLIASQLKTLESMFDVRA